MEGSAIGRIRRSDPRSLTQAALAEAAFIGVDMVSKIEIGATGARFPVVERLAKVLAVDPAEFFAVDIPSGALQRGKLGAISMRLAELSQADLAWIENLLDVALKSQSSGRTHNAVHQPVPRKRR